MERYNILEKIGSGTSGVVYKAEDKENGQIVAVKEIALGNVGYGVSTEILREVSLLKMLRFSSRVVRLLDMELLETKVILVLEYFEKDLKRFINNRPLPCEQIKKLLYQLLEAVLDCQKIAVIHRDLKPQNLLVDDKKEILKIADLDLGKVFVPGGNLTEEIGTHHYEAPELLLGLNKYHGGVDMWAVGCIFAEMSTGTVLFEAGPKIDQIECIFRLLGTPVDRTLPGYTEKHWEIKHEPQDLAVAFPTLGPDGVDLLGKMLRYDPGKRISVKAALGHRYFNGLSSSRS